MQGVFPKPNLGSALSCCFKHCRIGGAHRSEAPDHLTMAQISDGRLDQAPGFLCSVHNPSHHFSEVCSVGLGCRGKKGVLLCAW